MILSDLLAELRGNILRDRSDLVSGPSDQLWSDATLLNYINEAQRRFARDSLCLHDKTTAACCAVTLQAGVTEYALHPSVIGVISAKYPADNCDLARAGHAALGTYHMPDAYFFDPGSLSNLPPGKVMAFSTDEGFGADGNGTQSTVTLRVYPAPDAAHALQIQLRVVRLPINALSAANLSAYPEIPDLYHLDMLDWAAYLALRVGDHDAEDAQRSQNFLAQFNAKTAQARKDVLRKLFTPSQWGFGRNGFSWQGN